MEKTMKKIAAMFLVFVLMAGLLPSFTVKAEELNAETDMVVEEVMDASEVTVDASQIAISNITFAAEGLTSPTVGFNMDDFWPTKIVSKTTGCLSAEEYSNTLVGQGLGDTNGSLWWLDNDDLAFRFMDDGYVCGGGESFEYRVHLFAAAGYYFNTNLSVAMEINDGKKTVSPSKIEVKDDGTEVTLYFRFDVEEVHVHAYKTVTTKATLTKNGKKVVKCDCGDVKSTTTIYAATTIKLSATSYTYNGNAKKPSVTVKDSKGNTIATTNYTVTYPTGRKLVGSYTVKVAFKGNYSGSKSLTFKINPPKTSISTLTAQSKAFKVTWAKKTTQVTGYQIKYSTSSTFASGNKTVTVTSNKTVSKTISSLKAKKKYYVKIRTYKTVNGTKYYSSWSTKKSVTTK